MSWAIWNIFVNAMLIVIIIIKLQGFIFDQKTNPPHSMNAAFDFVGLNAYSVERKRGLFGMKTMIEFHGKNGGYWYAYTDNETHEVLVSEFQEYIEAKRNL